METDRVTRGIEQLVDHLRADRNRTTTISEVAAITEVLLATMQRYFRSVDTAIYEEFRHLSDHITRARTEISELRPNDLKEYKLPRAGKELEAIVQATEEATGTIMDAAEAIMAADATDVEAYRRTVNDACLRIFEACSFQDITGQRITKVVSTLTYVEDRLNQLQTAWGPGIEDADPPAEAGDDTATRPADEAKLLNGPALRGEGMDQSGVDSIFAGKGAATGPKDPPAVPAKQSNQDEIDALFG